jgi:DUF4097 and DUF4098 domain-containing protein YvlB
MNRFALKFPVLIWACLPAGLSLFELVGCHSEEERLVEATFEKNYPVNPDVRISIKNTDGSIRIYGANTTEVKLQAIKKAYQQDRLDKIAINVTAQPTSVSIDTVYPPKPKVALSDRSGTVDYVVVVPQNCTITRLDLSNGEVQVDGMRGKVTANLVNGRMFDHNGFGEHELFVANGGLDIRNDWWEHAKFSFEAKIVNGNLRASVPADASFHVYAATMDGNIANDFTEAEQRQSGEVRKVDAIVGNSALTDLRLQATNGSIHIIAANP